ncbi:hypothetical protein [Halarcobacter sp.]|nr:hypothetical protein [Halarcobacter sp.]
MVDYDFSTLNDKEFEDITLELISRNRGKNINVLNKEEMVE